MRNAPPRMPITTTTSLQAGPAKLDRTEFRVRGERLQRLLIRSSGLPRMGRRSDSLSTPVAGKVRRDAAIWRDGRMDVLQTSNIATPIGPAASLDAVGPYK